jgi:hypothetical protein
MSDGEYLQLFKLLNHDDSRIRGAVIAQMQQYIKTSDEAGRRRLVDAKVLNAVLDASSSTPTKDDLISFLTIGLLPTLGPSITHKDGGESIFPLLGHQDRHIKAAAGTALKNAMESRHGNVQAMAKAGMISSLHSSMDEDSSLRELWCYALPRAAPFLENQDEIDLLFNSLE